MKTVKATREGLVGSRTASQVIITAYNGTLRLSNFFVALPDTNARFLMVHLRNPANGRELMCPVLDVGPFNTHDSDYVFGDARPATESGQSVSGDGTNGSGIDLSEGVWAYLDMQDNTNIEWEFLQVPA